MRVAFRAPLARTGWAETRQHAATAAAVLVASAKLAHIVVSIAQKVNIKISQERLPVFIARSVNMANQKDWRLVKNAKLAI